jgi:hypothetical protein
MFTDACPKPVDRFETSSFFYKLGKREKKREEIIPL